MHTTHTKETHDRTVTATARRMSPGASTSKPAAVPDAPDHGSERRKHKTLTLPPMPWTDETKITHRRKHPVARLPKAFVTRGPGDLRRWEDLIPLLRTLPSIQTLIEVTTPRPSDRHPHRPRNAGDWAIVYLAMVMSTDQHPRYFHERHQDNPAFWRACGFVRTKKDGTERVVIPHLSTMYKRFAELAEHEDAFAIAAEPLIDAAIVGSRGHVGRHLRIDATQAQAHARLYRVCRPSDRCEYCGENGSPPKKQQRALSQTAEAGSSKAARAADRAKKKAKIAPRKIAPGAPREERTNPKDGTLEYRIGESHCWFTSVDPEASVRTYDGGKTWCGYSSYKAVCEFTGAPVSTYVLSSRTNEADGLKEWFPVLLRTLGGRAPVSISADRAYDNQHVRRLLGEWYGTALICSQLTARADGKHWDRYGSPRCGACGAPARISRCEPRHVDRNGHEIAATIAVVCLKPVFDECRSEQARPMGGAKDEEWGSVNLLPPTEEAFHAARSSLLDRESVHHLWRRNHGVAGDNSSNRLKSIGLSPQRLVSNAALLLTWVRICHREGWLGTPRLNMEQPFYICGKVYLSRHMEKRRKLGLDGHYGRRAVKADIGPVKPDPEWKSKAQIALEETAAKAAAGEASVTGEASAES